MFENTVSLFFYGKIDDLSSELPGGCPSLVRELSIVLLHAIWYHKRVSGIYAVDFIKERREGSKMKKLIMVLLVLMVMTLAACGDDEEEISKSALEEWLEVVLEGQNNFSWEYSGESDDPDFDVFMIEGKITDEAEYIKMVIDEFVNEFYVVMEDGERVEYYYDDEEGWFRFPDDADETFVQALLLELFKEPLNPEWFDAENGVLVLKQEYFDVLFGDDDITSFEIEFVDDTMVFSFSGEEDGEAFEATIVFFDRGTTTIELPDFEE